MERPRFEQLKKESWEIVKELNELSNEELLSRLQECSQWELEDVKGACYKSDPGSSSGSDGGIHTLRANAARASMSVPDFRDAIERISDAVREIEQKKPSP